MAKSRAPGNGVKVNSKLANNYLIETIRFLYILRNANARLITKLLEYALVTQNDEKVSLAFAPLPSPPASNPRARQ